MVKPYQQMENIEHISLYRLYIYATGFLYSTYKNKLDGRCYQATYRTMQRAKSNMHTFSSVCLLLSTATVISIVRQSIEIKR